ncbi:hypothetical protein [Pseudoxanthomonas winnipegensis]|jgi:hypothetical protein|uniref:Uncharacterized protein n=1 Tax=Pseudoxanthomonas winnipegensis TaxID=2480810 RepID=A0A4Q8LYR3_9GAMM|nr:hypothetical protein [Pseudoxanthomonas winnipegensis]RZZ87179.1 hypothetical protein EA663_10015 [Pseudoxanthomonas winnipegensis]TAA08973.1 hypothetical protein EA659_14180 [Pseudoxanthomonas winnipegensis]TAA20673.1 hypothetical protein EA658_06950 [Pseudoxanthomonas winnipegensis]TAA37612.1 hypothetical protein EA656_02815 [Pseudoxanthomonas winnipegensis]TAH71674.1 hypothetical protein EA657_11050 [Pseudoxanthomonas winnipegensis]
MKSYTVGAGVVIAVLLSFASSEASASCESICTHQYQLCISDGHPASQCSAERTQCLSECAGGSGISARTRMNIKDQNGQEIVLGQSHPTSLFPKQSKPDDKA